MGIGMVQVQEEEQKKPPRPVAFFIVHLFTVMSYCVYILYSETTGRFYIGMTENLQQRISQHHLSEKLSKSILKAKSTKSTLPLFLKLINLL